MKATCTFVLLLLCLFLGINTEAQTGKGISAEAAKQINALLAEKNARTPTQQKIDSKLWYAIKMDRKEPIAAGVPTLETDIKKGDDGLVAVEITGLPTPEVLQAIKNQGGLIVFSSKAYSSITARLGLQHIEAIAALPAIKFIAPAGVGQLQNPGRSKPQGVLLNNVPANNVGYNNNVIAIKYERFGPQFVSRAQKLSNNIEHALAQRITDSWKGNSGSVLSEGDATHKADLARTSFGVDGTGIKIGVLSDGVISLAASQASGNLGTVTVLPGQTGSGDEGTAMLEIIHDLAPGAQLYFATAFTSQASFAQNILDLRTAGCDIIADDVFYYAEAAFQDDNVARAVNTVTAAGALYFSSAGNQGNLTDNTASVWEGDFANGGTLALAPGGNVNDFGAGLQYNAMTSGGRVVLYWADPLGGSGNDYDIFVLNSTGTTVVTSSTNIQSGTQNPFEDAGTRSTGQRIVILQKTGAAARALQLNGFGGGLGPALTVRTSGQTHGHSSAVDAFSVAATPAHTRISAASPTGPYPAAFNSANLSELYSSDGPRRIFFDPTGVPLTAGNFLFATNGGTVRQKPDITAADGVAVTGVGGFGSPFYGTSAAAPHAAAIAALLKQAKPLYTAAQIRTALVSSAIDIETPGVDRTTGAGIVMAYEALVFSGATAMPNISSTTTSLVTEGCAPGNGVIDPGETVSVSFCFKNTGAANTVALTGTLSATGGVTAPGAAQNYGVVIAGGADVCKTFSFTANGTCGGTITATIHMQDGATDFGNYTFTFALGVPVVAFTQNFDALTVPGIPAGWVTVQPTNTGGSAPWVTSNSGTPTPVALSAPNALFSADPATLLDNIIVMNPIAITSSSAQLSFSHNYNLENTFDGGVLEISNPAVAAGAFQDIITAGGSFVTGGYTAPISTGFLSPIAGRNAWTGNSGGFTNVLINLPATAAGQNIQLRFREASDNSTAGVGWRIDNIVVTDGATCCTPPPCTITCPANVTVSNTAGSCGAVVNYPAPTISGTCGTLTSTPASGSVFPVGTTTVNVTSTAGPTCSFTVTVNDTQGPTLTCPGNITVPNTAGTCGAVVNFTPTATDNCSAVTVTSIPASGSTFPIGTTTVNVIATDVSANTTTCTFTVTVNDTQAPVITCPSNIAVNNTAGTCGAVVNFPPPYATDNCGPTALALTQTTSTTITAGSPSCNAGGLHTDNSYYRVYDLAPLALGGTFTVRKVVFGIEQANATTGTQPVAVKLYTLTGAFTLANLTLVGSQTFNIPNQSLSLFTAQLTTPVTVPANAKLVVEIFTPNGQAAGNSFFMGSNTPAQTAPSYIAAATCGITQPTDVTSIGFGTRHWVINPSGTVNLGSPLTVTTTPASGSTFPIGATTVTSTTTDAGGNTSTCTFTITVNDTQVPVITCPSNIVVNNTAGLCGAIVNFPPPYATDNCGPTSLALTQSSSNTITAGSISCNAGGLHTDNSYYRVYDLAPLALGGTFTVRKVVFGVEAATGAGGTQPIAVKLYTLTGAFTLANMTLVGSQTFNVPNQSLSLFSAELLTPVTVPANAKLVVEIFTPNGQAAGNSFFLGSNTLAQTAPSYIAAAGCGITQPTDLTAIGFGARHWVINPSGTVNTGSALTITTTPASGSTFPVGTTTVTSTTTDAGGNTATCTFTVKVNDTQAPVITCPANIVVGNTAGTCGAVVNYPAATATDNCAGTVTVTSTPPSGTTFPLGTTTVTATATDAAGNTSTCTFTVKVNDTQAPVVTCPANIVVSNTPGQCGAVVTFPPSTATDNCGPTSLALTQSASNTITTGSPSCNAGGLHTDNSYYRVYDLAPLLLGGTFTVNKVIFGVEQATGAGGVQPVAVKLYTLTGAFTLANLTLVGSQTFSVPNQSLGLFTANLLTPVTVPANAKLVVEIFTPNGQAAGNSFFMGSNTLAQTAPSYIAAATCGITQPTDVTAIGFGTRHWVINPSGIVNTGAPLVITTTPVSGSTFPVGTTTVTSTTTDAAGNTGTCTFTVKVNDTQAPTITCPANIVVSTAPNLCSANVTFPAAVVSDNCPGTTVTFSPASGSSFPKGVTTVTATATDASGNTKTCTFTVTVNDTQAPAITCPANITVSNTPNICGANVTFAAPTATDNCPGVTVVSSPASGSLFPVGTTTVTSTATDASGNTTSCTFTVTVNDTQVPVITCPANITLTSPIGSCNAVATFAATATDNCPGVTLSYTPASGSSFPVGTTTVTAKATDASGNIATCTFTVTVIDAQLPVISVQPANTAACEGKNATFHVTATNAVSYQWQVNQSPAGFTDIPGATSATLVVNGVTYSMNNNQYRVKVIGLCTTVTSAAAVLTVNRNPVVVLVAANNTAINPSIVSVLHATVSPTGNYLFSWTRDGVIQPQFIGPDIQLNVDLLGHYQVTAIDVATGCSGTSDFVNITDLNPISSSQIFISPNPTSGLFHVRYRNATTATGMHTLSVFDAKGARVFYKTFAALNPFDNVDADLSAAATGTYYVMLRDDNGKLLGAGLIQKK